MIFRSRKFVPLCLEIREVFILAKRCGSFYKFNTHFLQSFEPGLFFRTWIFYKNSNFPFLNIITLCTSVQLQLELELELYFYLDTVNLSDKIIILLQFIITVTIYFNLYKHDLKFKSKIEKK